MADGGASKNSRSKKASHQPGLGGFDIAADLAGLELDTEEPADLGHPLEAAAKIRPVARPEPPVARQAPKPRLQRKRSAAPSPPQAKSRSHSAEKTAPTRKRPARCEVGTSPECNEHVARIVSELRKAGPQPDASRSEFYQAAAALIAPVAHACKYSRLRPRGHWGEASARAFIETLSELYYEALGSQYVEDNYEQIRARVEADIAREGQGS